jgi:hypothetical protein
MNSKEGACIKVRGDHGTSVRHTTPISSSVRGDMGEFNTWHLTYLSFIFQTYIYMMMQLEAEISIRILLLCCSFLVTHFRVIMYRRRCYFHLLMLLSLVICLQDYVVLMLQDFFMFTRNAEMQGAILLLEGLAAVLHLIGTKNKLNSMDSLSCNCLHICIYRCINDLLGLCLHIWVAIYIRTS